MSIDGQYEIISRFFVFGRHGGRVIIRTDGNDLSGTAYAIGKESPLLNGMLNGNEFSFIMEMDIPLVKKKIKMNVKGYFGEGSINGTTITPFGKSTFEGKRII